MTDDKLASLVVAMFWVTRRGRINWTACDGDRRFTTTEQGVEIELGNGTFAPYLRLAFNGRSEIWSAAWRTPDGDDLEALWREAHADSGATDRLIDRLLGAAAA